MFVMKPHTKFKMQTDKNISIFCVFKQKFVDAGNGRLINRINNMDLIFKNLNYFQNDFHYIFWVHDIKWDLSKWTQLSEAIQIYTLKSTKESILYLSGNRCRKSRIISGILTHWQITYHLEHTRAVQLDFPYTASLHWQVLDCCTHVTDKMSLLLMTL